jgi:hypothetical protein
MRRSQRVVRQSVRMLLLVTAASLGLTPLATAAHATDKTKGTFTYSCCTASIVDATYRPGEVIRLPWIATASVPSGPSELVTLSARISGPYNTVASLKSAFARHTPQLGRFNAEADVVRVSSGDAKRYFSLIKVPRDATAGFYELTTTTSVSSLAIRGGAVIRVS